MVYVTCSGDNSMCNSAVVAAAQRGDVSPRMSGARLVSERVSSRKLRLTSSEAYGEIAVSRENESRVRYCLFITSTTFNNCSDKTVISGLAGPDSGVIHDRTFSNSSLDSNDEQGAVARQMYSKLTKSLRYGSY